MKNLLALSLLLICTNIFAQESIYTDSLLSFRAKYINEHEVVKGDDRKLLQFFPPDVQYVVLARFEKIQQSEWFTMETSGTEKRTYRPYGVLHFRITNTPFKLNVYQSKDLMGTTEYADYLFVPFTDSTNGNQTYENGRYIDFRIANVSFESVVLDFNKAYNPYCAYIKGMFNCPIPPAENNLAIAIKAGEKKYKK